MNKVQLSKSSQYMGVLLVFLHFSGCIGNLSEMQTPLQVSPVSVALQFGASLSLGFGIVFLQTTNIFKLMTRLMFYTFFLVSVSSYGTVKASAVLKPSPCVIVIGWDVSKTFKGYTSLNPQHLYSMAESAENANREVVFAFGNIGNPTDSSLIRCVIRSLPQINPNATLSQKAKQNQDANRLKASNRKAIDSFIKKVVSMTKRPLEAFTDINGFLVKAKRIFSEPGFIGYDKILYLNTDGMHDTPKKKELEYQIPNDVKVYTSGWKNLHKIGSNEPLESPEGFVDFISKFFNI